MKILYHHRTRAEDGQAVHIRSLIEAFRAEGCDVREVALVAKASPDPEPTAPGAGGARNGRSWGWMSRVPRFARELAEHAYTFPTVRRLVREGRAFAPDFLYERYAFANRAGVIGAGRLGRPLVLEVNSPMVLELGRTRGLSFPRLADRVERDTFRRADRVCVVTHVLADMLEEMGVERERLLVTPNGVHPEHYAAPDRAAARRDLGLADVEGPVLGFVGFVRDWHRLDLVVEGLTDPGLTDARLVLVGSGPAEDDLRERAERCGVSDRVHLAGPRRHAAVPPLLAGFDVALVPAINPYASPLKLFEYMAASLPVVAPDQPNLREIVSDGDNARLVPPGDGPALVEALVELVRDPDLRARLGAAAARTIEERDLTWRGNARRVLAAVGELV